MSELVDIAGRPLSLPKMGRSRADYMPFEAHLKEAIDSVEDELRLEDRGWINLSTQATQVISDADRATNLRTSRLYHAKDPLAHQAVRLWTDYTFGSGTTWSVPEKEGENNEATRKVLEGFWDVQTNRSILSARGQRQSSDKLLVDGEIFFALFLGKEVTIRRIDPLEITEIISNPEDIEDVRYYRRDWFKGGRYPMRSFYRSWTNPKNEPAPDSSGTRVEATEEAIIYHMPYNTISQRGNPLLLPALDWLKQYRRFLASRAAIMLAIAKFAWKQKVQGGSAAVTAVRNVLHEADVAAASTIVENMGVETTPIKQETGASGAYQDGRMLKLQFCAAVGITEQYFGDISIGNLATAKTVELPMSKMFTSYQAVWHDTYEDIDGIVLAQSNIPKEKRYVDRDFPAIAPADVMGAAKAMLDILTVFPDFATLHDVQQTALGILQINDTAEVLDQLNQETGNVEAKVVRALRGYTNALKERNNGGSK